MTKYIKNIELTAAVLVILAMFAVAYINSGVFFIAAALIVLVIEVFIPVAIWVNK